MSSFRETISSPHILLSIATGCSIIIIAVFSKRILPEPIGYLPTAVPPFIMTIFETVYSKYKGRRVCTTWYWMFAIFLTTMIVILCHM